MTLYHDDHIPEPAPTPGGDAATETPDTVQEAATEEQALDLAGTSLLGTMLGGDAPRALVRLRGGRIQSLQPGDRLQRATVHAIEPGAMILVENGRARRLALPGG